MTITIDWKNIENQIVLLALTIFRGYAEEAIKDFKEFRKKTEDDLKAWLEDLRLGNITSQNFKDLVSGQRGLLELKALEKVGLANIALDKFTEGVIQILIATVESIQIQ